MREIGVADQFVAWSGQAVRNFERFSGFVERRNRALVVGVLILVSLAKSGLVVWNWFELSPDLLTTWADPGSAFQSNVLFNLVGTGWLGLGLDPTSFGWLIVQLLITCAAFCVICWLVIRSFPSTTGYLVVAVLLSTGIASVMWREVGRYDAFFLAGIFLAAFSQRRWLIWFGAVMAALASPEQLFVAGLLLFLLARVEIFRSFRKLANRLLLSSILVLVAVQVWFSIAGNPYGTRIGIFLPFLRGEPIAAASAYDPSQGFVKFTIEKTMVTLSAGPSLVWSYLGVALFALLLCVVASKRWWLAVYILGVAVLAPVVAATVLGEDRTRDLTLISAPMILAIVIVGAGLSEQIFERLRGSTTRWMVLAVLIATVIPSTYFYLHAEEPFHWLKELVIAVNNGVPMTQDGSAR